MLSFHQPSPAMYELLDRAFLMSKGHVVFCGEPGAAYEHFEHAGVPHQRLSLLQPSQPACMQQVPIRPC